MPSEQAAQLTVYGLASCDSCRKAQTWLKSRKVKFRFHDLRADGLEGEQLGQWLGSDFAPQLLNRRSTTWRLLSDEDKDSAASSLGRLLMNHPTLIKRPVFTRGEQVLAVGFNAQHLERVFHQERLTP